MRGMRARLAIWVELKTEDRDMVFEGEAMVMICWAHCKGKSGRY